MQRLAFPLTRLYKQKPVCLNILSISTSDEQMFFYKSAVVSLWRHNANTYIRLQVQWFKNNTKNKENKQRDLFYGSVYPK